MKTIEVTLRDVQLVVCYELIDGYAGDYDTEPMPDQVILHYVYLDGTDWDLYSTLSTDEEEELIEMIKEEE